MPTCESRDSLSLIDYLHVEILHKLVDPIDDWYDFSCNIDLCQPSISSIIFNNNILSCENCIDQVIWETSPTLEDVCDVTNEPQVSDGFKNIG